MLDLVWVHSRDEKLAAHSGTGRCFARFDISPSEGRLANPTVDFNGQVAAPDLPVIELAALVAAVQLFVERGA